ncbi:MAG: hypothetical protein GC137_00650 [Alphaproteobacteria bacterium]|nr:hypothetical protein [Alphaproteobacteria bacterium]
MTLDFFSADNFFQKPLQNVSDSRDARKNYKPNDKDRDAFKVSNQNEARAQVVRPNSTPETAASEKLDFYQILQNVRNKTTTSQEIANLSILATPVTDEKQTAALFATDETALPELLNAIEPGARIEPDAKAEDVNTIANIAAINAEIQALIEDQITRQKDLKTTGETRITTTPEDAAQDLEGLFKLLTSFLEDETEQNPEAQNAFVSILQDLKGTPTLDATSVTEKVKKVEEANITLSNLTPAELTELQKIVQQYVNEEVEKRDQSVLDALAAQAATVIQQTPKQESDATRTNLQPVQKADSIIKTEQPTQTPQNPAANESRYDARYDGRYDSPSGQQPQNPENIQQTNSSFKNVIEGSQGSSASLTAQSNLSGNTSLSASERFLQSSVLASNSALSADSFSMNTVTTSQTLITPLQSTIASSITQSASATQAHPATQLVSATIQRAVKAGEETNIKLRLDPPDLGRVEVKMSIDKDNKTKIVLTAEKPETYMLLKQDAQILERAMAEAGLATNGELSFELASDNQDRGNSENPKMGKNAGSETNSEEVLETTMDWHVDPHSGRMRYNTLV